MRTAIYTRLSEDRAAEGKNVAIQESECREYAEGKGWETTEVFTDNDISASRYSRKPRPAYLALLEAIRAGQVEAVLVTEMPRLYRRMDELLELIDLAERTPLRQIVTADETGYDLSTGQGIHSAHTAVSTAWLESRRLSDRAKRKKKAQAKEGRYAGGPACYGYHWTPSLKDRGGRVVSHGKLEVDPTEAALIRDVTEKLLAGRSLRSVCQELNRTGKRTTTGAMWRPTNLKRVLTSHRIIGIRIHNGVEYPGTWEPILDRDTWERLGLVLNAEARFVGAAKKSARTYLLTGMIFCGHCGAAMNGYGKTDHAGGPMRRRYYCRPTDDTGRGSGCGKVSRLAEPVDVLVGEMVLERVDSGQMAELLAATAEGDEMAVLLGEHQAHKLRLEETRAAFASGKLSIDDLAAIRDMIEDAMEDIQQRMSKITSNRTLASVPVGQSFREAWDGAELDWRRSLVDAMVERVVLHPGRPGAHRWSPSDDDPRSWQFDPTKVEIRWRV